MLILYSRSQQEKHILKYYLRFQFLNRGEACDFEYFARIQDPNKLGCQHALWTCITTPQIIPIADCPALTFVLVC